MALNYCLKLLFDFFLKRPQLNIETFFIDVKNWQEDKIEEKWQIGQKHFLALDISPQTVA